MDISLPSSGRRKALFVIDVQPNTLAPERKPLIAHIANFIRLSAYDGYVEANYFADESSMFFKQGGFLKTKDDAGGTAPEVSAALSTKGMPRILVEKNTRSCFKAVNSGELHQFLKSNKIEEAHFLGYDINDCVLASAYEAIDLGYFTFVLEELCQHAEGNAALEAAAVTVFRSQDMTNVSTLTERITVSI